MPEPLTLAGLTIATLAALPAELIGQGLGSGISRGTRGLLRILRRQPGDLPVNHDLQRATGDALEKALGLLASAVRERQGACENAEHRHWCDLFVDLARNRKAVRRVDEEFSLDREELFEAVSAGGGEALESKMSEAVLRWARRELEEAENTSEPLWFAAMVRSGFDLPAGTRKAGETTSLHQAFCEFFHEDLKGNERVFRIFTAFQNESIREGLAELSGGSAPSEGEVKEVKAALESHSVGSDELAKFFGEETERIHRKLDALRAGQAEIREGVHKLVKIGGISLVVLGLVGVGVWKLNEGQEELRTGQKALFAANEKRDVEVRALLERINRKMMRSAQLGEPARPRAYRYERALAEVAAQEGMRPEEIRVAIEEFVGRVKRAGEASSFYDRSLAAFAEENFAEAAELADRSVEEARRELAEVRRDEKAARGALGVRLFHRAQIAVEENEWAKAAELMEEAVRYVDREEDPDRWVKLQLGRGEIYGMMREVRRSVDCLSEALAFQEKRDPDGESAWTIRRAIGLSLVMGGEVEAGEKMLREALKEFERLRGPEDRETIWAVYDLGQACLASGLYAEAEENLNRFIAGISKLDGERSFGRWLGLVLLSSLSIARGEFEVAVGQGEEAVAGLAPELGEEHVMVLHARFLLGIAYLATGKQAKGVALLEEVFPAFDRALGPHAPIVVESTVRVAELYRVLGRYSDAEALLLSRLEGLGKESDAEGNLKGQLLLQLSAVYETAKDYPKAERTFKLQIAHLEDLGEDARLPLQMTKVNLSRIYSYTNRLEAALSLCTEAVEVIKMMVGPEEKARKVAEAQLADLQARRKKQVDEQEQN